MSTDNDIWLASQYDVAKRRRQYYESEGAELKKLQAEIKRQAQIIATQRAYIEQRGHAPECGTLLCAHMNPYERRCGGKQYAAQHLSRFGHEFAPVPCDCGLYEILKESI